MSDDRDNTRTGRPGAEQPPVGSVAEEAALLFSALADWAKDHGAAAQGMAGSAAHAFGEVNDHIATGGDDCRYCPVCQAIHVVRETSPEVKAHLALAANSLVQAAAGLLATHLPRDESTPSAPVEKIDLDDPDPDGADQ